MSGKRREEAKRWFQQARHDLAASAWNVQGGFFPQACFWAQQAGEKALKALLYYLGFKRRALMTHSLVEMVRIARDRVPELSGILEDARELDLHYIPSRYPNGLPSGYPHVFYSRQMAEKAYAAARRVVATVQAYFEKEAATDILEGDDEAAPE